MISRLYVGFLCSVISILLGGCLKPPNEWLGIPFVPEAYDVRWAGRGYTYVAPATIDETISWYQEKLAGEGWSASRVSPRAIKRGIVVIGSRKDSNEMRVHIYGPNEEGIIRVWIYARVDGR